MRKIENKQILPEFGNVLNVPVEDYHGVLPVEPEPEVVKDKEDASPAEEE